MSEKDLQERYKADKSALDAPVSGWLNDFNSRSPISVRLSEWAGKEAAATTERDIALNPHFFEDSFDKPGADMTVTLIIDRLAPIDISEFSE